MSGILKTSSKASVPTAVLKDAKVSAQKLSDGDMILSFKVAKANARKNTIIAPLPCHSAGLGRNHSKTRQDFLREHERKVHFIDDDHAFQNRCPQCSQSEQTTTTNDVLPQNTTKKPFLDSNNHPKIDPQQFDIELPEMFSSIIGVWKDARSTNEMLLALKSSWLNTPKEWIFLFNGRRKTHLYRFRLVWW